jgi:predicted nucleic-acid-binding Zn-ribbon protein
MNKCIKCGAINTFPEGFVNHKCMKCGSTDLQPYSVTMPVAKVTKQKSKKK